MDTTNEPVTTRAPLAPVQQYALLSGGFLLALGILSLVLEDGGFGTVGPLAQQPEFLIWSVNGWTSVFWIAVGAVGVVSAARFRSAREFALIAGMLFAAVAVWGFIDGDDVVGLLVADTTNNVTHAVLAGLGLLAAAIPPQAQRPEQQSNADRHEGTSGLHRFDTERHPTARPR